MPLFNRKRLAAVAVALTALTAIAGGAKAATSPATAPAAPERIYVLYVTAQWTVVDWRPVKGAVSYGVYRNGGRLGQTPFPLALVTGLDCGRKYEIAVDSVGPTGLRSKR